MEAFNFNYTEQGIFRFRATFHASGVRTMGGDPLTVVQLYIRHKPFIALYQSTPNKLRPFQYSVLIGMFCLHIEVTLQIRFIGHE